VRGPDRTRRPERGQTLRVRPLVLSALVVGSLLLAAIVLLPAGRSVPDHAARPGSIGSSRIVRPARLHGDQRRERARTKRAARSLSRRQSAARERRAAARRADRRRAVAHDRAIRPRKQQLEPAVPVVAASTARLDRRMPAARPREPPAATAEFEP
jgi:hypothetical protein